jgi:hypothetical protein
MTAANTRRRRSARLAVSSIALVAIIPGLSGCSGSGAKAQPGEAPSSSLGASAPTATGNPSSTSTAKLKTARDITLALKAAGIPLTLTIDYSESSDPNNLLGRPNGYASKTAFRDKRAPRESGDRSDAIEVGGSVEMFPDHAAAKARGDYISGLQKRSPLLGNEYEYISGAALLRLSTRLTPTVAQTYKAAFDALSIKS